MGNPRKTMGKPAENRRKTSGKPQENRKTMGNMGNSSLWTSSVSNWIFQPSLVTKGYQPVSVNNPHPPIESSGSISEYPIYANHKLSGFFLQLSRHKWCWNVTKQFSEKRMKCAWSSRHEVLEGGEHNVHVTVGEHNVHVTVAGCSLYRTFGDPWYPKTFLGVSSLTADTRKLRNRNQGYTDSLVSIFFNREPPRWHFFPEWF